MKTATQPRQQVVDEFTTQDIEFAAVMKKEGVSLNRLEGHWREEGNFVFQASEKIEEIKRKYGCGELRVDPDELVYLKALTFACRK